jgi:hypothetical protein
VYRRLRAQIEALLEGGSTINEVEEQIIEPLDLPAEVKDALWLYAWSYVPTPARAPEAPVPA